LTTVRLGVVLALVTMDSSRSAGALPRPDETESIIVRIDDLRESRFDREQRVNLGSSKPLLRRHHGVAPGLPERGLRRFSMRIRHIHHVISSS
jgi:hypothetical protein